MPTALSPQSRNVALVVAAALFMQILDGVIIVTALPRMAQDFRVDTLHMSLGITVYMVAVAICIPAAAWLADRFGAKRVFVTSILAFTLASIACAMAQSFEQFIVARAVQGAGGSVLFPLGRILVLRAAKKSEIVSAIGLTIWPALFAPVIGPALGGFLTQYASWHWNFWINIPVGLAAATLVALVIPRDTELEHRPFDWIGFLLTAGTLASLLYGFETLVQGTLPALLALLLVAIGCGFAVGAVTWLRRHAHPLLDLNTFRVPTFRTTDAGAGVVLRIAVNASPFLLPLMFQVAFGLNPLEAGSLVVAYFFGNLAIKAVTTPTLRRFGFRSVLVVNGLLAAVSVAACGLLGPATPYPLLLAVLFVAGVTRSMQFTALATLAFADVDATQRSSATTLSSVSQQLSMMLGVAVPAGCLNLIQMWRGDDTLAAVDFQLTFALMGLIILIAALRFLRLSRTAGAEVSGHVRRQPA